MIVQCESNQQSAAPTSPPRRAQRIVRRVVIASLSGPRAPVRTGAFGASWVCRFAWRPAGLGAMRLRSCWLGAPAVKRPLAARPRCTRVPSMTARTSLPLRLPRSCASTRGSTHSRHCARSSVSARATRPVRRCRPQRARGRVEIGGPSRLRARLRWLRWADLHSIAPLIRRHTTARTLFAFRFRPQSPLSLSV